MKGQKNMADKKVIDLNEFVALEEQKNPVSLSEADMKPDANSASVETADIIPLTLPEVIQLCQDILDGKLKGDDMLPFLNRIYVVRYKNLIEKDMLVSELLFKYEFDSINNIEWNIVNTEQYKLWYLLLSYTNIQIEGYEEYCTLDNYDIVFSVLGDAILSFCERDYNRTIKMFDDAVNVFNLRKLLEGVGGIDEGQLNKSMEDLKEELAYLDKNKDMLENLAAILK
jgi:hypothetical protein